jgi:hypothetical protein
MLPERTLVATSPTAIATAQIGKRLPVGYCLGENDVYCGRGSQCSNHIGNRRFNQLVLANLDRYCNATSRTEKTSIIYAVVDKVRESSPDGGFVKQDTKSGQWYEVGDLVAVSICCIGAIAIDNVNLVHTNNFRSLHIYFIKFKQREKTSQAFRDATFGMYKSSRTMRGKKDGSQKKVNAAAAEENDFLPYIAASMPHSCMNESSSGDLQRHQQIQQEIDGYHFRQSYHHPLTSTLDRSISLLEDFEHKASVVPQMNRILDDSLIYEFDDRKIASIEKCVAGYGNGSTKEASDYSSCCSKMTMLHNIDHYKQQEGYFNAHNSAVYPSSPCSIDNNSEQTSTLPPPVSRPITTMTLLDEATAAAAATAAETTAVSSNASDSTSDARTFDLLVQLYESWKRR